MANKRVGLISVDAELRSEKFTKGSNDVHGSLSKLKRDLTASAFSFNELTQAFNTLSNAVEKFGEMSVGAAIEFNKGMANVATLIPGNTNRVKELGLSAQDMAVQFGKSTADMTEGLYNVISAFGDTSDTVKVLGIASQASIAGLSSTTDALELLSATTKTYGDTSAEAMQKASDLAFTTVRLGQTTFPELSKAIQQVASDAQRAGVSQEELFAAFSATTGVIGDAQIVATKFRAAITAILSPSESLKQVYSKLGVASGEALIAQNGLQKSLAIIVETAKASNVPLQSLIGSTEGQAFASSIASAQAQKFAADLDQMAVSSGATAEAFNEQANGVNQLGFVITRAQAQIEVSLQKIGQAFIDNLGPQTTSIIDNFTTGIQYLTDRITSMRTALTVASELDGLNKQLEQSDKEVRRLTSSIEEHNKAWFDFGASPVLNLMLKAEIKNNEELRNKIQNVTKEFKSLTTAEKTNTETLKKQNQETQIATPKIENLGIKISGLSKQTKVAKDEASELAKKWREFKDETYSNLNLSKLKKDLDEAIQSLDPKRFVGSFVEYGNALRTATIDNLQTTYKVGFEEAAQLADTIISPQFDEISKQFGDGLKEATEMSAKVAEDEYRKSFDRIADSATSIIDALAEGTRSQDWGRFAEQMGSMAAEAAGQAMGVPGLGRLVDPIISITESIGHALSSAFGGHNPGREARDAIESELNELLGYSLDFSYDFQSNWSQSFANIAGDGQAGFEAIGAAIALMSGQSIEYAGQVGYAIADQLGGNLNDARLLVQSLGLDAESMGKIFEQAAQRGEISWHEFEVRMQGINEVTAAGRLAVGDFTGAYEAFVETSGRGAISVQALRNIAIEAGEAGAKSVGDLQELMHELGYDQEEINRWVQALSQRGINNLDDLQNASTRVLGGVIADLESLGLSWVNIGDSINESISSLTDLQETLRGIQHQTIDLTVKINYEEANKPPAAIASSLGNIFTKSGLAKLQKFANGGIVASPTYFGYNNGLGLMGEAGPEAVMPLTRNSRGKLSVNAEGLGSVYINVDATGAQAGVKEQVISAIQQIQPTLIKSTISTIRQMRARGAL